MREREGERERKGCLLKKEWNVSDETLDLNCGHKRSVKVKGGEEKGRWWKEEGRERREEREEGKRLKKRDAMPYVKERESTQQGPHGAGTQ